MIRTESGAWRHIARELEKTGKMPIFDMGYDWGLKKYPCKGLCSVVSTLGATGKITWEMRQKMTKRIQEEVTVRNGGRSMHSFPGLKGYQFYLFPKYEVERRIILAQFFACAARDEEKEAARIAALDDVGEYHLGDDELEEIKQIASRDEDEDDGYVARQNALVEGAEDAEVEAGAGSDGYDLDTRESDAAPW